MKYHQCSLHEVNGDRQTVAWIEERGAHKGAHVEMKDIPGAPFFEVVEVYAMLDQDTLRAKQAADRNPFGSIIGAKG